MKKCTLADKRKKIRELLREHVNEVNGKTGMNRGTIQMCSAVAIAWGVSITWQVLYLSTVASAKA